MAKKKAPEKFPTWLYHKTKGGKIHALAPGAPPPKGWRDTPWPQDRPEETQALEQQEAKDPGGEARAFEKKEAAPSPSRL